MAVQLRTKLAVKKVTRRCASSHLTLSVYAHVQRVISAWCAVHHGWSPLGIEVVTLSQAVERTGLHPTWTHTYKNNIHTRTERVHTTVSTLFRGCCTLVQKRGAIVEKYYVMTYGVGVSNDVLHINKSDRLQASCYAETATCLWRPNARGICK